jgi:delta 1-pyrroline-5-carboxylate dehydrogenase
MAPCSLVAALATSTVVALPTRALGTAALRTRPLLFDTARPRARALCSAASAGALATRLRDPSLFRQQAYVNGRWADATSGKTFSVTDPATGEALGSCADLGGSDTAAAIAAAKAALPGWSAKTGKERAAVLRRWYELMMANQQDLALIMTMEQGKPLAEVWVAGLVCL